MSYTKRHSQITLSKVATNLPVPSQSPYSKPLTNFTFILWRISNIAIYLFVYILTRKQANSLRSQCLTPSRHTINSCWMNEQMDGVLGNQDNSKKKLRTRLSRWPEYKVNVLGLYPSGNKSEAYGRKKKKEQHYWKTSRQQQDKKWTTD